MSLFWLGFRAGVGFGGLGSRGLGLTLGLRSLQLLVCWFDGGRLVPLTFERLPRAWGFRLVGI